MGMESFFHRKQPAETYDISVDFGTFRMESGEALASQTAVAVDGDGNVVTSTYIGTPSKVGDVVYLNLKETASTTSGNRITITIVATADSGNKYEQDIILEVVDRP